MGATAPRNVCVLPHAMPRFKEKLAEFLRVTPDVPDSVQDLQDKAGIRLLIGGELRCNPPDDNPSATV